MPGKALNSNPASVSQGPVGTSFSGHRGVQPWSYRQPYKAYKSPFGPNYKTQFNFHGITRSHLGQYAPLAAGYGAVAGIFAIFFFAEVPRVRQDIMVKIPVVGYYFKKEIAPEDNPF